LGRELCPLISLLMHPIRVVAAEQVRFKNKFG
jgi:hypothetical protein